MHIHQWLNHSLNFFLKVTIYKVWPFNTCDERMDIFQALPYLSILYAKWIQTTKSHRFLKHTFNWMNGYKYVRMVSCPPNLDVVLFSSLKSCNMVHNYHFLGHAISFLSLLGYAIWFNIIILSSCRTCNIFERSKLISLLKNSLKGKLSFLVL
jgi:hypothetical protein